MTDWSCLSFSLRFAASPLLQSGVRYVEYFSIKTGKPVCGFACKRVCVFAGLDACMLTSLLVCRFAGKSVFCTGGVVEEGSTSFFVGSPGFLSSCVNASNLPIVKFVNFVLWLSLQFAWRSPVFFPVLQGRSAVQSRL